MPPLAEASEVDDRRDHHQAANADALALQLARDLRRAKAAIAFAGDEFDRRLPSGLLDPFANEDRERLGVAVDRPEPPAGTLAARGDPAVAGAGRIDEDEIGKIEPALRVRLQRRRGRHRDAIERQPPRADRAETEIGGGRARPAVEHESDGPL